MKIDIYLNDLAMAITLMNADINVKDKHWKVSTVNNNTKLSAAVGSNGSTLQEGDALLSLIEQKISDSFMESTCTRMAAVKFGQNSSMLSYLFRCEIF